LLLFRPEMWLYLSDWHCEMATVAIDIGHEFFVLSRVLGIVTIPNPIYQP